VFAEVEKKWGGLDFLVHAIAFSNKDQLKGKYVDTTADNFALTMNVSCYSFTAVAQRAVPLMKNGGSLLTLTYYGAERVIPHYNVMGVAKAALEASVRYLAADLGEQGIRVNAISAGPDQDAGLRRHRRQPLHPEVERAQLAAQAQRRAQGGRQRGSLPVVRHGHRRDR
jgi:enoyl-[acyl-carrier-protein] reductase (NADH)